MEYIDKVKFFVGMFLCDMEEKTSSKVILDSDLAYDIAMELHCDLGIDFEYCTEDIFAELLSKNEILSVSMICSNDGRVKFYLESIFNKIGETLIDDYSDVIWIQDDLVDCINMEKFNTDEICIFVGDKELDEEECNHDCANCKFNDDDEDYEKELENNEESLFEALATEMLVSIGEYATNDKELTFKIICDKIEEVYELGKSDMQEEIQKLVENIRF